MENNYNNTPHTDNVLEARSGIWNGYKVFDNGIMLSKNGKEQKVYSLNEHGYWVVYVYINCKKHSRLVHRILAEMFIPNPENKPTVNHKDLNKLNYSLDNLEWATHKEQSAHAIMMGAKAHCIYNRGIQNWRAKINEDQVIEIRRLSKEGNLNYRQLGKMFGLSRISIIKVVKNITWKHIPQSSLVAH